MRGFVGNIEEITVENNNFRKVVFTGQHTQLVVMSIEPSGEIGKEVHAVTDQFLRIEKGEGKVIVNGEERLVKEGDGVIVPAGTEHNVINTSSEKPLKLYTLYSPPHHRDGIVHETRKAAEEDETDHL